MMRWVGVWSSVVEFGQCAHGSVGQLVKSVESPTACSIHTSSCGMKPRHAAVPQAQGRPCGPALGGPYAYVSSSPAAMGRAVMNTTRGSSDPVRLKAGRERGKGEPGCFLCENLVQTRLEGTPGTSNAQGPGPTASCIPRPPTAAGGLHAPAQQQPEVAAVAGMVEEAGQVAPMRCINVEPHRRCAAGQPLTQHLAGGPGWVDMERTGEPGTCAQSLPCLLGQPAPTAHPPGTPTYQQRVAAARRIVLR